MKNVKTFAIVTAIAALALAAPSAFALCGSGGYAFGHGLWASQGYVQHYVKGHATAYADLNANWWGFGNGNPALALGADNGNYDVGGTTAGSTQPWMYPGVTPNFWFMTGTTDTGPSDGCPKGGPLVLGVSDQSAGVGYFAVTVANDKTNPTGNQWDFGEAGTDQIMVAIPKPNVTGSTRLSTSQTQVTVSNVLADFQGGYYPQPGVTQTAAQVITGFKVYTNIVARNATAPTDRKTGWTVATPTPVAMGGTGTVTLNCATNSDAYLALSVVFDGATPFETAYLGPNSTKIQCGPVLAEPPQFKIIPKKQLAAPTKQR